MSFLTRLVERASEPRLAVALAPSPRGAPKDAGAPIAAGDDFVEITNERIVTTPFLPPSVTSESAMRPRTPERDEPATAPRVESPRAPMPLEVRVPTASLPRQEAVAPEAGRVASAEPWTWSDLLKPFAPSDKAVAPPREVAPRLRSVVSGRVEDEPKRDAPSGDVGALARQLARLQASVEDARLDRPAVTAPAEIPRVEAPREASRETLEARVAIPVAPPVAARLSETRVVIGEVRVEGPRPAESTPRIVRVSSPSRSSWATTPAPGLTTRHGLRQS